jgi:alpha-ketoglutarate-dependent taurine dioxygenase
MQMQVRSLTKFVGSEIRAEVAALLSSSVAAQVRELLVERGVLVFPKINMSDRDQVAFASLLGTVREEGKDGIFKVTLNKDNGPAADYLKGSFLWHLDGTHDEIPIFASLLSGRVLSAVGGETEFASSYAAYEALPQTMKDRIADLTIIHSVEHSMLSAGVEAKPEYLASWRARPERAHKLVWTHQSGRKSLVVGCHAKQVIGMDRAESDALIKELLDWITQPQFVYRHHWSVGDLLIWDNTGVLHRAEPYPADSGRMMHRTTLVGAEAFN